jgi:hypothetical protein
MKLHVDCLAWMTVQGHHEAWAWSMRPRTNRITPTQVFVDADSYVVQSQAAGQMIHILQHSFAMGHPGSLPAITPQRLTSTQERHRVAS